MPSSKPGKHSKSGESFHDKSAGTLSVEEIAGKVGRAVKPEELQDALRDARKFGNVRERYRDGEVPAFSGKAPKADEIAGMFGPRPTDTDIDEVIRDSSHAGIERRTNRGKQWP